MCKITTEEETSVFEVEIDSDLVDVEDIEIVLSRGGLKESAYSVNRL
jgi:DNA-binding protein YbaB